MRAGAPFSRLAKRGPSASATASSRVFCLQARQETSLVAVLHSYSHAPLRPYFGTAVLSRRVDLQVISSGPDRIRTCDLGIKSPRGTAATECSRLKLPATTAS